MAEENLNSEHVVEILLLRPMEPVFVPKGPNKVVFDIPKSYEPEEFQDCNLDLKKKHSIEGCITVKIHELCPHPREIFAFASKLGRRDQLSDFLPEHQEIIANVIEAFDSMDDFRDFLSLAVYARDNLNPGLFSRAFSTASLHRSDLKGLRLPAISSIDPFKFFSSAVMSQKPVGEKFDTASNLNPEQRVAYFREDMGVNSHHWKWHLVYPMAGPVKIVKKDRRGELFYYMHQQMIARYNAERLSNQLGKVRRFNNFTEPIPEAYFPKMGDRVSMRNYPARHANSVLRDINRKKESFFFDIAKLDIWRSRIYEAIDSGFVKNKEGNLIKLTPETGIDVIGNLLESSILSVNKDYYGDLHASGHIACGVIHDPDHAHLEDFSVMGDVATACRDPFFYRWHAMIDEICQSYKNTLEPYPEEALQFPNITIESVDIVEKNKGGHPGKKPITLNTYWNIDTFDIANGLDFQKENKRVLVEVKHLQYQIFDYNIVVSNIGHPQHGTVRIFIAPKLDEDGEKMTFRHQRTSFIEMDKFTHYFETGTNIIGRCSCESSVTILQEDTFFSPGGAPPKQSDVLTKEQESAYFCGCGWPNHMLVPKGTCDGMAFDLFVMVSDFKHDNVNQSMTVMKCGAPSFCGIRDKLYPDKRSMGFPFDRNLKKESQKNKAIKSESHMSVGKFAETYSNMFSTDIIIRHKNTTVLEPFMKAEKDRKEKCLAGKLDSNVEDPAPIYEHPIVPAPARLSAMPGYYYP